MQLVADKGVPREREDWAGRYDAVRAHTEMLAAPLSAEDQTVQSMPDASPTKWHRAHVTWFFENFLLAPHLAGYRVVRSRVRLFVQFLLRGGRAAPSAARARGLLSRARHRRDRALSRTCRRGDAAADPRLGEATWRELAPLVELGLNHEEQHQELLLMDILHVLSCNSLDPAYANLHREAATPPPAARMAPRSTAACAKSAMPATGSHSTTRRRAIASGSSRFASPRASSLAANISPSSATTAIAGRNCGCPKAGRRCSAEGWTAPLYWRNDGRRLVGVLARRPPPGRSRRAGAAMSASTKPMPMPAGPASACRPKRNGKRRPTERGDSAASRWPDEVWQWTASPYVAYPGFRPPAGAIGEYNGKFMSNQMVLRGGAAITPAGHAASDLSQFLPARRALVHGRHPPGGGCVMRLGGARRVPRSGVRSSRASATRCSTGCRGRKSDSVPLSL